MELGTDEILVWNEPCHMIMKGGVVFGDLTITNKRLLYRAKDTPKFLSHSSKFNDFWDLDVSKVSEINIHNMVGMDHPMIRIRYKEDEVFLRFPDYDPRKAATALIVFVNHARLIERVMSVMRSIDGSLKEGNLNVGENLPHIMIDLPNKADEECFQCGKPLVEDEIDTLTDQIKECFGCIPDMPA